MIASQVSSTAEVGTDLIVKYKSDTDNKITIKLTISKVFFFIINNFIKSPVVKIYDNKYKIFLYEKCNINI